MFDLEFKNLKFQYGQFVPLQDLNQQQMSIKSVFYVKSQRTHLKIYVIHAGI